MKSDPRLFRISELERRSGISRRTIHFYFQEGLLHPPLKTGKTMSYYDEDHLRKLIYIRKAKQRGQPLFAIRNKLQAQAGTLSRTAEKPDNEQFTAHLSPSSSLSPQSSHGIRGKKTREKILNLSCILFRRKGYRDTKVSDITRELDIGKGTFYFYFTDKRELFFQCIPLLFQELFSGGWDRIRQAEDPLMRLQLRAKIVLPALREFCAIIQLSKESMESSDTKLRKLGEQTYLSIRRPLEIDIEKGMQLGIFQNVDPKIASTLMIGMMESLNYLSTIEKKEVSIETLNSVLDFIFSHLSSTSRSSEDYRQGW